MLYRCIERLKNNKSVIATCLSSVLSPALALVELMPCRRMIELR